MLYKLYNGGSKNAGAYCWGTRTRTWDTPIRCGGALGNDAWPAEYLFAARGKLVKRWVGEGSYDEIDARSGAFWWRPSPASRPHMMNGIIP